MNVSLRRSIAVAAIVLTPVLSSCGFDRPTDRVYTPGVGVNDRSAEVDVLNALVVSGADGSGSLVATLSNANQSEGDALTQVSGPDARVALEGPIELNPGGWVSLSDEAEISVEGENVRPGTFIELTFDFESGETATLEVPVVARRGPYADLPVPSVAPTTAAPEDEESSSH